MKTKPSSGDVLCNVVTQDTFAVPTLRMTLSRGMDLITIAGQIHC